MNHLNLLEAFKRNKMNNKEKFELIEKTIKEVQGNFKTERLIQDCSDKLSLSVNEVKNIILM